MFDFITDDLRKREHLDLARIRQLRRALDNQLDDLLAFAGVIDAKLADISHESKVPLNLVRTACLLQRKSPVSSAYWHRWYQLHRKLAEKFCGVVGAVVLMMKQIPRTSSLAENVISALRTYLSLHRQLGTPCLVFCNFP